MIICNIIVIPNKKPKFQKEFIWRGQGYDCKWDFISNTKLRWKCLWESDYAVNQEIQLMRFDMMLELLWDLHEHYLTKNQISEVSSRIIIIG